MSKPVRVVLVGVALLMGGCLLGVGTTLAAMVGSFHQMAGSGGPAPEQLSEGLNISMIATATGILVAIVGLCLTIGGLVAWMATRR